MDAPSPAVLVVDDDPSIRLLCRVNLELDGWPVLDAATLDEARALLAKGDVGIVLLDVHVGDGSGSELLGEIRRAYPDIRVAMLTGSVGSTAPNGGAVPDAVIGKPFTLEKLRTTVLELAR